MEHIRQRLEEHTPRSHEIAEDPASFASLGNALPPAVFPGGDLGTEGLAVSHRCNAGHTQKELAELLSIRAFWCAATPHESLSLHVDQAALQDEGWPELAEHTKHVRIAIHRATGGGEALRLESSKEGRELVGRTLGDVIFAGENTVGRRIHQGNNARRSVQERAIKERVRGRRVSRSRSWWWLREPVLDDAVDGGNAVATLVRKLPRRVAFADPAFKPNPLAGVLVRGVALVERSSARSAYEALSTIAVVAIPFCRGALATGAQFFCGAYRWLLLNQVNTKC